MTNRPATSTIDAVLEAAVGTGAVPNLVATAATADGETYEAAAGPRAAGHDTPVGPDSIFRIASMTKIVCTVAALQLCDRGSLDIDTPVQAYCARFADVPVLDGFDGDRPRLRRPASRATVRQLLNHTTGLAYGFWNAALAHWEAATRPADSFSAPMTADPGTRFEYGTSTDWLGKVVEAVSGQSLRDYLAEQILLPLDMSSTTFVLDAEQRARCVPVHARHDGRWVATDIDWSQPPAWWSGGHGLYSTPRDFLRFQRMLLAGGTLAGREVLARSSVDEIFSNQIDDLWFPPRIRTADPATSGDFVAGTGNKWGWGLLLSTADRPGRRSAGTGSWAGIFNTYYWIDPRSGITAALYSQLRPFVTPGALRAYEDFEHAVYRTLSGHPSAGRG